MKQHRYDYLIVGAGLFGSVCARELADAGKRVLVLERRAHAGGNAYTEKWNGIHVHRYGAHIFHTNDDAVWRYVRRFAEFNRFTNCPVANYKGELYSLPFNMNTFHRMWGVVTPGEAARKLEEQRKEINREPENLEEQAICLVGREIYEKLVRGYTEKQWGRPCRELPADIIRRLPLRLTFDSNYFDARHQGIPTGGYTAMISRMLDGIEIRTSTDYLQDKALWDALAETVIYTGEIDAYFRYCLGALEYRSLRFETEALNVSNYQGIAVMNYTDRETPWTRIIEHKWFTFGKGDSGEELPDTVITREYSAAWKPGENAYYPIHDSRNMALYQKYQALARSESRAIFGGRLGEYKYCDMDQTIASALHLCRRLT